MKIIRNVVLGCGLVIVSQSSFAQTAPVAPLNNNAAQFAAQAGAIAGSAQACGQNVTELNNRVSEVINALTSVQADQQAAILVYQKILDSAEQNQKTNNTMQCKDVLLAYNSLPLLKPDYKTTILPVMAKLNANK